MARLYELKIKNFRGIRTFSQKFGKSFYCFVGRGDSGKTTIIEAISLVLSPNWNISFFDTDFFNGLTANPIEIEASMVDLPDKFIKDDKFGLYIRGIDDKGDIQDELKDEYEKTLTIRLEVKDDLEPHWYIINNRQSPLIISGTDREKFNVFTVSDYVDRHFSWCKGNPLYSILKGKQSGEVEKSTVIIEALREAKRKIDQDGFSQFKDVTQLIKEVAEDFGIDLSKAKTTIDFKDVSLKDGRVCLHDGDIPLRLKGKGTKRLVSMAIQTVLGQQGGIMLIDEVEQGLEPDRARQLIRALQRGKSGQVFVTTHSSEVITELEVEDLALVNNESGDASLVAITDKLQNIFRACPAAAYVKKAIVCEGKTEIGICRELDLYRQGKDKKNLTFHNCTYVLGEGDSWVVRALKLKELGLDVATFCDSDKDKELVCSKSDMKAKGIKIFDCESGKSIEDQIFDELPWDGIKEILAYLATIIAKDNLETSIEKSYGAKLPRNWKEVDALKTRQAIAKTSKNAKWFKRVESGEFLGSVIFKFFEQMNGKKLVVQLEGISNWVEEK